MGYNVEYINVLNVEVVAQLNDNPAHRSTSKYVAVETIYRMTNFVVLKYIAKKCNNLNIS